MGVSVCVPRTPGASLCPPAQVFSIFLPVAGFQILLSLFVAVILDNLELDEDLKKLKQVGSPV